MGEQDDLFYRCPNEENATKNIHELGKLMSSEEVPWTMPRFDARIQETYSLCRPDAGKMNFEKFECRRLLEYAKHAFVGVDEGA